MTPDTTKSKSSTIIDLELDVYNNTFIVYEVIDGALSMRTVRCSEINVDPFTCNLQEVTALIMEGKY